MDRYPDQNSFMKMKANLPWIILVYIFFLIISSCSKDSDKTNQAPTCKITTPANGYEIAAGEMVNISVTASDNDGNIVEIRFIINDEEISSVAHPPYSYIWNTKGEINGNHTIKATCIDNNGDSSSDEITVMITEHGEGKSPHANFTANSTSGSAPFTVSFIDLSKNNPTSWRWDFGDGDTNTTSNPTHTYVANGYYNVTLTVSNNQGSNTKTKTNYIYIGSGGIDGDPCPGTPTVIDADSNIYNTVLIGSRCWMKENLRVGTRILGRYRMANNGEIEKYCYNDLPENCLTYGGLYQWDEMMQYTLPEGQQGICPDGWHLPSDDEWKQLEIHLGMSQSQADKTGFRGTDEGYKIKSDLGWNNFGNGNNISGFSGLPGGYHHTAGNFRNLTVSGSWWSTTEHSPSRAWRRGLYYNNEMIRRNHHDKTDGLSVRCVRN